MIFFFGWVLGAEKTGAVAVSDPCTSTGSNATNGSTWGSSPTLQATTFKRVDYPETFTEDPTAEGRTHISDPCQSHQRSESPSMDFTINWPFYFMSTFIDLYCMSMTKCCSEQHFDTSIPCPLVWYINTDLSHSEVIPYLIALQIAHSLNAIGLSTKKYLLIASR